VSLLAQAARGTFLALSLELPSDVLGASVRIAEGVLGVWLVSGLRHVVRHGSKAERRRRRLYPSFVQRISHLDPEPHFRVS
jgi:hypothetical protein